MPSTKAKPMASEQPMSAAPAPLPIDRESWVVDRLTRMPIVSGSGERTVKLCHLFKNTRDELQTLLQETMNHAAITPEATIEVIDKDALSSLWMGIHVERAAMAALEAAIRQIMALSTEDLEAVRMRMGNHKANIRDANDRLQREVQDLTRRHRELSPEQILGLPEYQKAKAHCDATIATSLEKQNKYGPVVKAMSEALASVGC